jgi:hypothetical protein
MCLRTEGKYVHIDDDSIREFNKGGMKTTKLKK